MSFTIRAAQATLNTLFGKTSNFPALASAINWHLGASTTTPTEAGGNISEPSGMSYARVATPAATWTAATNADPSVLENTAQIAFAVSSGNWGTITHLVLFDALTAGNALVVIPLTTPKAIDSGDTLVINAGELDITAD